MEQRYIDAINVMDVCGNDNCVCFGDDTPDMYSPDHLHRCLMCGVPKVSWRTIPVCHLSDSAYRLVEAANLASDPLR